MADFDEVGLDEVFSGKKTLKTIEKRGYLMVMLMVMVMKMLMVVLQVTSTMGGTSEYPMATTGDFVPKKTLSGKPGEPTFPCHPCAEVGRLMETSGGSLVQEMRWGT